MSDTGALAAATGLAASLGLQADDATVIRDGWNLLVWLRPAPVVARVQTRTAPIRAQHRVDGSIQFASFLATAGVPVTPPTAEVAPGPHRRNGYTITLWERFEVTGSGWEDPAAAGRGLRMIHDAGREYDAPYAGRTPLEEVLAVAATLDPERRALVETTAAAVDLPDLPTQWLHGDCHLGNVLQTTRGTLWGDWEECLVGSVAWDLSRFSQRRDVFGEGQAEITAALDAYGGYDPGAVAAHRLLDALWAGTWLLYAGRDSGVERIASARRALGLA